MIRLVQFISQNTAEKLVGRFNSGMISITAPGEPADLRVDSWGALLRLEFDDVDPSVHRDESYTYFSEKQAKQILDWLEENEDDLDSVFVHCMAGISRSAAVAMFIAEKYEVVNFPYTYRLYNKHVYSTLRKVYYGSPY